VILTEETRSVLAAEASLPSLPRLVAEAQATEQLAQAADRWSGSWELPVEQGRAVRARASAEAAEPVARAIGASGVATAVRSVGETLTAAALLESGTLAEAIAENLERAEDRHAWAVMALAEGRDVEALSAALEASDLIREVGPESVGRLLLARAEAQLGTLESSAEPARAADGGEVDLGQVDLERGRRLIRGARLALEEGDYVRTIQRAYYACQVLGVDPS
jgi:hypothetical protein